MLAYNKILHLSTALLLLVSSTGITMHKHYCMDRLKSVSYFEKGHSCMEAMGMEVEATCPMNCCEDVTEAYKVDELARVSFKFNFDAQQSVLSVATLVPIDFDLIASSTHSLKYQHYKPPLIDRDISVLVQSFQL